MHGFIAEVAECGIESREQILGKAPKYIWINDNGPFDFVRDGIEIQQKFVILQSFIIICYQTTL